MHRVRNPLGEIGKLTNMDDLFFSPISFTKEIHVKELLGDKNRKNIQSDQTSSRQSDW